MEALRKNPPRKLGELGVISMRDGLQADNSESTQPKLPRSNLLAFALERGHRVLMRPSGTEPKLKIYMEWREELRGMEPTRGAALRAKEGLCCLEKAFLQWVSP